MEGKSIIDPWSFRRTVFRILISFLFAVLFYLTWMGIFINVGEVNEPILETILWVMAPILTSLGFAVGITVFERLTRVRRTRFLRIYVWPLVGCTIGAGVLYWFGPMLIVFGMFVIGSVSIVVREADLWNKINRRR